jgi:hypothetical protein
MENFLIALFSVSCGAVGFLLAQFWFQPILKYRQIKSQIISDLIFYGNVINAEGLDQEMQQRVLDRMISNRRHSADLTACFYKFPSLYRKYLMKIGERPDLACGELMGLSNTSEYEAAQKRMDKIQALLRIDPRVS